MALSTGRAAAAAFRVKLPGRGQRARVRAGQRPTPRDGIGSRRPSPRLYTMASHSCNGYRTVTGGGNMHAGLWLHHGSKEFRKPGGGRTPAARPRARAPAPARRPRGAQPAAPADAQGSAGLAARGRATARGGSGAKARGPGAGRSKQLPGWRGVRTPHAGFPQRRRQMGRSVARAGNRQATRRPGFVRWWDTKGRGAGLAFCGALPWAAGRAQSTPRGRSLHHAAQHRGGARARRGRGCVALLQNPQSKSAGAATRAAYGCGEGPRLLGAGLGGGDSNTEARSEPGRRNTETQRHLMINSARARVARGGARSGVAR